MWGSAAAPSPKLFEAERSAGFVKVPEKQNGKKKGDADPLDLSWNASRAIPLDASHPPSLERQNSVSGNILTVHTPEGTKSYWLQRKIAKTACGSVRVGFLLEKDEDGKNGNLVEWDVVKSDGYYPFEMVAVKMKEKSRVFGKNGNSGDEIDPRAELSALKLVARHDPDGEGCVLGTTNISTDQSLVYIIMPYFGEGSLFQYVAECGRLEEAVARHFFKQILQGLKTLGEVGLCHRSLSLEKVLMRGSDVCLSDLRSSVPNGSELPMTATGGDPRYLAPEIVRGDSYDGCAVDLWAAGVMLCGMLFGDAPFVWASNEDVRFKEICVKGNLKQLSSKWETAVAAVATKRVKLEPVSDEALDLIQKMLRAEPSERLTLEQVMLHPWVEAEAVAPDFGSFKRE